MPSLEADRLTKVYRKSEAPVVDHVSFRYEGGGAIGYLGPNGSGKSTTLKLFTGLVRPTEGRALIDGVDPRVDRRRALSDVGAVIESSQAYPSETIFEALDRVGRLRGLASEGIDEAIDRCTAELELPPLYRRCGTLSTGQRQRVALAAARIGDPRVLLLDEPTDGMDPVMRNQVLGHLRALRKDHLILLCSHLLDEVLAVCDHVLLIDHGRIVVQESLEGLLARAKPRLLLVEFASPISPEVSGQLAPGAKEVVAVGARRLRIEYDGEEATRQRILEGAQRLAPVRSFGDAVPALEEAYAQVFGPRGGGKR